MVTVQVASVISNYLRSIRRLVWLLTYSSAKATLSMPRLEIQVLAFS